MVWVTGRNCQWVVEEAPRMKERGYDENRMSEVEQRMALLNSRLEATRDVPPPRMSTTALDATARGLILSRLNAALNQAYTTLKVPAATRNHEALLAQLFAVEKSVFGFGDTLSPTGFTRVQLRNARRLVRGATTRVLAEVEFFSRLENAQKVFDRVFREAGIDRATADRLKLDALEVGYHPYLQTYAGIGPEGLAELRARQTLFNQRLVDAGITQSQSNEMMRAAFSVADGYHDAMEILTTAGVRLEEVTGIGYVNRAFSQEAQQYLRRLSRNSATPLAADWAPTGPNKFFSAFTQSRNFYHYVVEDGVLLEYALRYHNAWPEGVESVEELLLDQSKKLPTAIFNGLPESVQMSLIDTGVLSKIQFSTTEVYDHLVQSLDLPFKELNELVATDLRTAARVYASQLEEISGRSGLTQLLAKAALEGNWGVPGNVVRANPEQYRGFVRLVEEDGIGLQVMNRFGVNSRILQDTYVHSTVANLYNGMMEVSTNPTALGVFAPFVEFLRSMNTATKRMALFSTSFPITQAFGNMIQSYMAGGDLLTWVETQMRGWINAVRASTSGRPVNEVISSFWDDTRRVYHYQDLDTGEVRKLTEKELWEEAIADGRLDHIMPWTAEDLSRDYRQNPGLLETFKRQVRYSAHTLMTFDGSLQSLDDIGTYLADNMRTTLTGNLVLQKGGELMYQFQLFSSYTENLSRFATLKTLTHAGTFREDPVGFFNMRVLRSIQQGRVGRPMHMREAFEGPISDYFFDYQNLGSADRVFNNWVMPFWIFQSRNQVAVLRYIMRNPSKFVAWNRLYAAANHRAEYEGEDLPYAGIPQWHRESKPIVWVRTNEDTGEKEYFSLFSRPYDPIADATETAANVASSVQRMLGFWPDSRYNIDVSEEVDRLPGGDSRGTMTSQLFQEYFDKGYNQWTTYVSLAIGEDVVTGREWGDDGSGNVYDSFLGLPMKPWLRYVLETNIPLLQRLNRSNPGLMFGRAPYVDERGNYTPGVLSWWGTERSRRDVVADYRDQRERMLQMLGVRIYGIDVPYEMGRTETQMSIAVTELTRTIAQAQRNLSSLPEDSPRAEAMEENIELMKLQLIWLREDLRKVYYWRKERGYISNAARNRILSEPNLLNRQQIPESELYEIIEETLAE